MIYTEPTNLNLLMIYCNSPTSDCAIVPVWQCTYSTVLQLPNLVAQISWAITVLACLGTWNRTRCSNWWQRLSSLPFVTVSNRPWKCASRQSPAILVKMSCPACPPKSRGLQATQLNQYFMAARVITQAISRGYCLDHQASWFVI